MVGVLLECSTPALTSALASPNLYPVQEGCIAYTLIVLVVTACYCRHPGKSKSLRLPVPIFLSHTSALIPPASPAQQAEGNNERNRRRYLSLLQVADPSQDRVKVLT